MLMREVGGELWVGMLMREVGGELSCGLAC